MSCTCQPKSNITCANDQHDRHSSKIMNQIDNKQMTMQHDMKQPKLPCKTRLATKPCNGVNTGSKLRCKTATTNNMESKKVKLISHAKRDVQVPPTDEGQRTNIMHMQSSSRRATKKEMKSDGWPDSRGRDHKRGQSNCNVARRPRKADDSAAVPETPGERRKRT